MRSEAKPCILCKLLGLAEDSPADFHHTRVGQTFGRRGVDGIWLCAAHHRNGPDAIHVMGKKAWEQKFYTEQFLLDKSRDLC